MGAAQQLGMTPVGGYSSPRTRAQQPHCAGEDGAVGRRCPCRTGGAGKTRAATGQTRAATGQTRAATGQTRAGPALWVRMTPLGGPVVPDVYMT